MSLTSVSLTCWSSQERGVLGIRTFTIFPLTKIAYCMCKVEMIYALGLRSDVFACVVNAFCSTISACRWHRTSTGISISIRTLFKRLTDSWTIPYTSYCIAKILWSEIWTIKKCRIFAFIASRWSRRTHIIATWLLKTATNRIARIIRTFSERFTASIPSAIVALIWTITIALCCPITTLFRRPASSILPYTTLRWGAIGRNSQIFTCPTTTRIVLPHTSRNVSAVCTISQFRAGTSLTSCEEKAGFGVSFGARG